MGGGAAGFEIDSADTRLGTPPHALVVAKGVVIHPDYGPVNEDMLVIRHPRPQEDWSCADMVFFETPAGGAVFSVGSMTYVGSLPVDDGTSTLGAADRQRAAPLPRSGAVRLTMRPACCAGCSASIPTLLLTWTRGVRRRCTLIPGDPVLLMLGGTPTSEEVVAGGARAARPRPPGRWCSTWTSSATPCDGDFGDSFRTRQPVIGMIGVELPYTLRARRRRARGRAACSASRSACWPGCGRMAGLDAAVMTAALAGVSLPSFWIGMLLIQVFATDAGLAAGDRHRVAAR